MNQIMTSSFVEDAHAQADGGRYVREQHMDSDGFIYSYQYLCPANLNPNLVMQERVLVLNEQLRQQFEARQLVVGTKLPLTKLKFRELFTAAERMAIDEFNYTFESNVGLTTMQKRVIRSGLEDFKFAQHVDRPFDSRVIGMLDMYVQLGIITPARKDEIVGLGNGD